MIALKTPAPDAPAEEWGALAERIPGWADLPGDRLGPHRMPRLGPQNVPDPDHWAWEGYMFRLLGNERWRLHLDDIGEWSFWVNGPPQNHGTGHLIHVGESLGRACIRVAAVIGRWPGGDS